MVSASLVKELRELTGAGMLDCKKALEECNGSIEEATTWLREKGISKAAKKADRIAAEGLAAVMIEGNTAVVVEVKETKEEKANLETMTVAELRDLAKQKEVKGYSTMKKAELLEALK